MGVQAGMINEKASMLKLMIVDDEPDNLDLLYRTFWRDFEVIRAESARDALQILDQRGEMAIIISDQRMPEMLGTEFLSRTVDRFPDTIRIVLTGYTDVEDLVEAINSGKVFKYITKPWKPQQLQLVVQQAAETYRVLKQRTEELRRALRRESLYNDITTVIRESLDYRSMLQTIVEALGQSFAASYCMLQPVEDESLLAESFVYCDLDYSPTDGCNCPNDLIHAALTHRTTQVSSLQRGTLTNLYLVVPFTYQQDLLAILALHRAQTGDETSPQPPCPWSEEDIDLIEGVAEQAALAISQAKLYHRTQRQAKQMQAELAVARQIQSNLLRQTLPVLENVKVQACCQPAREVGGDFFEVYLHPQGDIWLAVGDVSGKGVPAALFMASAISVLRRELAQENSPEPDDVMANLNSLLLEDLVSTNCFITMVLAKYTPTTKQLVYANAGHIYPLVWSIAADAIAQPQYLKVRGVPLGILPKWKAAAGILALNSGDVLLLASDGITEASISVQNASLSTATNKSSSSTAMLQQSGLWDLLQQTELPLNLNQLLTCIQAQNAIQEDDQTLLSLEVL
jgi:serine phosphatase RsbU (regulator of sigma subunit)/CheY-like chemotaxis protein